LGDPSNWLNAMNWLLGSIGTFQITEAVGSLILVVLITLTSFFIWKPLDLLSVNEVTAKSSGVDVVFYRKLIFVLVSLLTAICVSLSGIIGFVGFIIPHALRLMGVTSHKRLIPCAFLLGGSLLLFSDMLARFIIPSTELPVGVVMAMIGTPSFLALIRKSQR